MEEMIYTPTFGERVTHVISVMHTVATANNCNVKASFNDYELTVTPSDNPTEILSKYNEEMDKREAEYKSSIRYKQLKEDFEQRKNVQRRRLELLCKHYPNFKDIEAVIEWLEKVSECDLIQLGDSGIIETFEVNGYFAASSIHIEEYVSDKDTSGRWLIKQALDFIIKFGTIYPMFKQHIKEWKDKYGVL
jgi:hypothetical protein